MDRSVNSDTRFQQALIIPELPPPEGITAWNGDADLRRFDVYRNNVIVSLIDALANTFTVVQQLVGEPFFRAMAREYLREPANLPSSPVLAHYGGEFPSFIAVFEPASSLPFLSEVARLEWMRLQALHAADVAPVESEHLATHISSLSASVPVRLCVHPSAALFISGYAAVSIWAAHQGLMKLSDVNPNKPEQALILRPGLEVELLPLQPESVDLISRLMAGEPLPSLSSEPAFERTLDLLLYRGAITSITAQQEE